MDEFGVLVESMGFRAQGKSAPLAELKPKPKSQFEAHSPVKTAAVDDSHSLPMDELDGIFRSNSNTNKPQHCPNFLGSDDLFGGPASSSHQYEAVDLESVFNSSSNRSNGGGNSNSRNSAGSNFFVDDLLGSTPKQRDPVGELFGEIGANSGRKREGKGHGLDDLMPGFGGSTPSKTKVYSDTNRSPSNSSSVVMDDPFLVFESVASQQDPSWPFGKLDQDTGQGSSAQSTLDDLDDFIKGGTRSGSKVDGVRTPSKAPSAGAGSNGFVHVDEIFGGSAQNSFFDNFFHEEKRPEVTKASSPSSFATKKSTSATNIDNNFASLFGDAATSSGEFHEIDGEPEERRRARLNRHMRTYARAAEALAEKNQRDLQSQLEQEEKQRLGETLDYNIKRWATGKAGNIRALLSSLQEILWPECGWRPVSITDIITPESVKKVYKKATLCVHPDKVQQKGATIHQKYIAEKVFDLLKESWNKFNTEELR